MGRKPSEKLTPVGRVFPVAGVDNVSRQLHSPFFNGLLKGNTARTDEQQAALIELTSRGLHTATAFRVRELLRWVRAADTKSAARWRSNRVLAFARKLIGEDVCLEPVAKEALIK